MQGLWQTLNTSADPCKVYFLNIENEKIYTAMLMLVKYCRVVTRLSTASCQFCHSSLMLVFAVVNLARKWHGSAE